LRAELQTGGAVAVGDDCGEPGRSARGHGRGLWHS